jgi:LPXTG-motif cell wall-anchored protein
MSRYPPTAQRQVPALEVLPAHYMSMARLREGGGPAGPYTRTPNPHIQQSLKGPPLMYNLPHTGIGSALLALVALIVTGFGALLRRLGRRR